MNSPTFRKLLLAFFAVVVAGTAAVAILFMRGVFQPPGSRRQSEFSIRGIDVSHHQGGIEWAQLRAQGVRFAYIKASEGGNWRDPAFAANLAQANAAGLPAGAYHFFTFCIPGAAQARNFIGVLAKNRTTLPPAIDIEYVGNCSARPTRAAFASALKSYIAAVEARYGQKPILYCTRASYRDYLSTPAFAGYPLWVRDLYGTAWWAAGRRIVLHQIADHERFTGIVAPVDVELFRGSEKEFRLWAAGQK